MRFDDEFTGGDREHDVVQPCERAQEVYTKKMGWINQRWMNRASWARIVDNCLA